MITSLIERPLRGGDAVFFWGTGFLSASIEALTDGPSHVATILDPLVPLPDGMQQHELHVIESTILHGCNGVQVNTLANRVNGYDLGGTIVAAYLSRRIRELLDWTTIWGYAARAIGEHYNVAELAAYLANMVLPGKLQIDHGPGNGPHPAVCSEFRAELLRAGGLPCLDPFRTPPQTLWRGRMYEPGVEVLTGAGPSVKELALFNTV